MKVETPEILWNSEDDKGFNAALNSISLVESGLSDHGDNNNDDVGRKFGNVMVTAGNTNVINLWKVSFPAAASANNENSSSNNSSSPSTSTPGLFQETNNKQQQSSSISANSGAKIEYLCGLTRQELSVNTVAFSPDGLHLATGGESGAIVVWSVPPNKRGNGNGRHYWSTVKREQDLNVRIVGGRREGINDISWSADSKRFVAGTIDHTVLVYEDKNYDANQRAAMENSVPLDSDWKEEYKNGMDHTLYVQGVAYDPLGAYLASLSSDRSLRVFPRKTPPKAKKKVLRPSNAVDCCPPPDHQRMVDQILTDAKLELGKSKQVKFRPLSANHTNDSNSSNNNNDTTPSTDRPEKKHRRHLYADESTHNSSFRRLAWTIDGAFLVTPAALWHSDDDGTSDSSNNNNNGEKTLPSFATYLFARHRFDEPYKVLHGLEKPSVVVRPSPVLYKLPNSGAAMCTEAPNMMKTDCKENEAPPRKARGLPYRSVFAVLTVDTILVYDTHHTRPLSVVRGLHYAGFSDCHWTNDGMKLIVANLDGYISIVSFEDGEFGDVYTPPAVALEGSPVSVQNVVVAPTETNPLQAQSSNKQPTVLLQQQSKWKQNSPSIPPCEPGQTATLEAPPSKRPKKTRIAPTLITPMDTTTAATTPTTCFPSSSSASQGNATGNASIGAEHAPSSHPKRSADEILQHETHTKLTLSNDEKPKKKKRIQPLLVSAANN